jgi:hypothetical protein
MKSKKPGISLRGVLVSSIVVLAIGFLGLGIRAFAPAYITHFAFFALFAISGGILVLYFMLHPPARELTAHLVWSPPPEAPPRADVAVARTAGDSAIVSP